jgi:hypothetical protein
MSTNYYAARDIPEDTVMQPEDITTVPPEGPCVRNAAPGAKWSNWIEYHGAAVEGKDRDKWAKRLEDDDSKIFVLCGQHMVLRIGDTIYDCLVSYKKILIDHAAEEMADKEPKAGT